MAAGDLHAMRQARSQHDVSAAPLVSPAGVTGLAAPMANAADAEAKSPLSPMATFDSLTVSDIPTAHKDGIPRPSSQPAGLHRLNDLGRLNTRVRAQSAVARNCVAASSA